MIQNVNKIAADILSFDARVSGLDGVLSAVEEAVGSVTDMMLAHEKGVGTTLEFQRNQEWSAIVKAMRYPRFVWSGSRNAYYVQHSTDQNIAPGYLERIAQGLERSIPGIRVGIVMRGGQARTIEEQEAARKERSEDRAARYSKYAAKAASKGRGAEGRADRISERFFMGQPILIGHHSERKARRDQDRMHDLTRKAVFEFKKAGSWSERAKSAEAHMDYRESPMKVQRRIERREAELREIRKRMDGSPGHDTEGRPIVVKPSAEGLEFLKAEETRLNKEIAYWRKMQAQRGLRSRDASDFRVGETFGGYAILRVGPKSITVANYPLREDLPGTSTYSYVDDMKPTQDAPREPAPEPEAKGKHPRALVIDAIYRKYSPNEWKVRIGWKHAVAEGVDRGGRTTLTVLEDAPDAVIDRLAGEYGIPLTGAKPTKHPHAKLIKAIYSGVGAGDRYRDGEEHVVRWGVGNSLYLERAPDDKLAWVAVDRAGVDPADYGLPFPTRDARMRAFVRSQRISYPGKSGMIAIPGIEKRDAYYADEIWKLPPDQTLQMERLSDADLLRVIRAYGNGFYGKPPAERLRLTLESLGLS